MKMQNTRALILKFDGIDGCGKTSLMKSVADYYSSVYRVLMTSEFGSDYDISAHDIHPEWSVSRVLRQLALGKAYSLDDTERQMLLAIISRRSNRIVLAENAKHYDLILVDRSNMSNFAYGIVLDPEFRSIYSIATSDVDLYDLTFWIDTPIDVCLKRMENRSLDAVEQKGRQYLVQVREQYELLSLRTPGVRRLDGALTLSELTYQVADGITDFLRKPYSDQ